MSLELDFPISAIFIGSSFGIASITFIEKALNEKKLLTIEACMVPQGLLLFCSILCIFASKIIIQSQWLGLIAVCLLMLAYIVLLALCVTVIAIRAPKEREREKIDNEHKEEKV